MSDDFKFAVDLPNAEDIDGEWVDVEYFDTYEEAVAFCKEHFGADDNGCICLVSKLPQEDEVKDE